MKNLLIFLAFLNICLLGFIFYPKINSNKIYVVNMEYILKQKDNEITSLIHKEIIKNKNEAISKLKLFTNKVKKVIYDISQEKETPIFDKRVVISLNQVDITKEVLKRLRNEKN